MKWQMVRIIKEDAYNHSLLCFPSIPIFPIALVWKCHAPSGSIKSVNVKSGFHFSDLSDGDKQGSLEIMQIFLFLLLVRALFLSINIFAFPDQGQKWQQMTEFLSPPALFPSFSKSTFPPQKQYIIFNSLDADDLLLDMHKHQG